MLISTDLKQNVKKKLNCGRPLEKISCEENETGSDPKYQTVNKQPL